MADEALLPDEFSDLEPFGATWCLASEKERHAQRLTSSFDELKTLYDAVLSRLDDAFTYLNAFPLDEMPPRVENLMLLTLSLAEVAPAVEFFGQPEVVDGFDEARFEILGKVLG